MQRTDRTAGVFMQLCGMVGERGMPLWRESMCSPFGMQRISLV